MAHKIGTGAKLKQINDPLKFATNLNINSLFTVTNSWRDGETDVTASATNH